MRLGFSEALMASKKNPRILIRVFPSSLLPAFIGSDLLATTERSAISQPIDSAFPFGLYLHYLAHVSAKEATRLPSVICTFCSIHPDPNHVNEPCRSYPFPVFLQDMHIRIGFPVFTAGHPTSPPPLVHRIPGWILPAGPLDSPSRETPCQSFSFGVRTSASATALKRVKLPGGFEPPRLCDCEAHTKNSNPVRSLFILRGMEY